MDNMKTIMENWNSYKDREHLLSDSSYISGVLGVKIPLNESYPYSPRLTEEIINEHLLYEGFLDSLKATIGKAAGSVKNLLKSFWIILKDKTQIGAFIVSLGRYIKRKTAIIIKALEALGTPAQKVLDMVNGVINKYNGMQDGWKKVLAGSGFLTLLSYINSKLGGFFESIVQSGAEKIAPEALKQALIQLRQRFYDGTVLEKIVAKATDPESWLAFVGSMVGGVKFVADALSQATSRFQATS